MRVTKEKQRNRAILFQSLYLTNLLLLPGLSFIYLLWLLKTNNVEQGWQRIHLYRAIQLSIVAGVLLVLVPVVVIYGMEQIQTSVMLMLVYFVTIHALLILVGMLNLSRSMAQKLPIF